MGRHAPCHPPATSWHGAGAPSASGSTAAKAIKNPKDPLTQQFHFREELLRQKLGKRGGRFMPRITARFSWLKTNKVSKQPKCPPTKGWLIT